MIIYSKEELDWREDLKQLLSKKTLCRENYLMKHLTTLKIGGPADLYIEPVGIQELRIILDFCAKRGVSVFTIGNGSNLLVKDGGIRGVVLGLKNSVFSKIELKDRGLLIEAGAGARLRNIAIYAQSRGVGGVEFVEGIPGSLGGAIRMNAGAYKVCLFDVLESVSAMDMRGNIRTFLASELSHGYRSCPSMEGYIILKAELKVYKADEDEISAKMKRFRDYRQQTQAHSASAGCTFKNPPEISAGKLIDQLGLKGMTVGGAKVSEQHGNFLINKNDASANDLLELMDKIKNRVKQERGIDLETEIMIIGEDKPQEKPKPLVTVFRGGISREREVSLNSGRLVAEALRNAGYQVKELDPDPTEGWSLPLGTEVVFLALHGTYGEDGQVQSELDRLGIPYTGSGAEASRIGFDKLLTRKHCEALGVKMPKAMLIDKEMDQLPEGWRLPVILKPLREGSSVGLQVVEREEDFFNAVREVLKYGSQALMEDKISGRELTASILNGEALPLVELRPKSGIYDYKSKYTSGATEYICPAKISDILTMKVQEAALKTFYAVGARDYARVDMILDREGQCWVLEINTLPGMSTTSLLPKAAAAAGLNYEDLCSKMVELALKHSTVTS